MSNLKQKIIEIIKKEPYVDVVKEDVCGEIVDQIFKEIIKEHETSIKLEGEDEIYCDWYKCLKCGDSMITNGSKYCPNCGRKIKSKLNNIKE